MDEGWNLVEYEEFTGFTDKLLVCLDLLGLKIEKY